MANLILRKTFDKMFMACWEALEGFEPRKEKIDTYYEMLRFQPASAVSKAFKWYGKHDASGKFPTGPKILERIKIFKNLEKKETEKKYLHTKQTLAMTPVQIADQYNSLKRFFKTNPYPESSPEATMAECRSAESKYNSKMREAGHDPDELLHPRCAMKAISEAEVILSKMGDKNRPYSWLDRKDLPRNKIAEVLFLRKYGKEAMRSQEAIEEIEKKHESKEMSR